MRCFQNAIWVDSIVFSFFFACDFSFALKFNFSRRPFSALQPSLILNSFSLDLAVSFPPETEFLVIALSLAVRSFHLELDNDEAINLFVGLAKYFYKNKIIIFISTFSVSSFCVFFFIHWKLHLRRWPNNQECPKCKYFSSTIPFN